MFKTTLILQELPQPDLWSVVAPLTWDDGANRITVPVGLVTDLASIPRLLRNLSGLDPDGVSRCGAVLHDWLYRTHQFTREASDDFLRRAIVARGGTALTAWLFWKGVRVGGQEPWDATPNGPTCKDFDTPRNYLRWLNAKQ